MAGWQDAPLANQSPAASAPAWQSAPLVGGAPQADFSSLYQKYGNLFGIDPNLLRATAQVESSENPDALGPAIVAGPDKGTNATGLMQVTNSTNKDFGGGDLSDPDLNILRGAQTLRRALNAKGNYADAFNAYSGGGGQDYYNKILANYTKLGGDPSKLAYTPDNLPPSAAGAVQSVLGPIQTGQQPFAGKGTFGRAPGATQAPNQVANALNNALVGVAHGGVDVPVHSVAEGLGWGSDKLGLTNDAETNVDNAVNDYNQIYKTTNAANGVPGEVGNIGGGIGAAMMTPGANVLKGASLLSRIGAGILGGATYGAEQNSSTGNSLPWDVGTNAGIGAAAGALSPLVTKPISWLAGKLADSGAPLSGEILPPGITPSDPLAAARARQANFDALGLKPTLGMLGRDPQQWQIEQDTAAQAGIGKPFTTAFQQLNTGLRATIDNIKSGVGATALSPREAGLNVTNALTSKWGEMQANQVSPAYAAIMKPENVLPPEQFNSLLQSNPLIAGAIKDIRSDPIIGSSVQGMPDSSLPVLDLAKRHLDDLESSAIRSGAANRARIVGGASNDLVNQLDANFPGYADARQAAEDRFGEFDRKTLGAIQKGNMEPDDVLHKALWSGPVANVDALKSALLSGTPQQIQRGTAAWNDLRGQTVDKLVTAGFGSDGTGKFSPAAFTKALNTLGQDRLSRIFTPDEMTTLARIQMAGKDAFSDVPFSSPNHSHSGAFVIDQARGLLGLGTTGLGMVNKASGVAAAFTKTPWTLLTKPAEAGLGKMAAKSATNAALNPDIEALIATAARRRASQSMAALLNRLPFSNTAAAYNENRSAPQ